MSTFLSNKTISKRRLCGKKTPSPNSMLLPTNAQGSGFLLNTQQHCFQGKGERKEPVLLRCLEKYFPSMQFSQHFCPRLYFLFLITSCTFSDCCFPCIPLACWLFSKHMWLVLGSSTLSGHPVLDPNFFPDFAWIFSVRYSRYCRPGYRLTSCQFTNEPNREISRGVFQNHGIFGQAFLLPTPSVLAHPSIFHFFCFPANSVTRLGTISDEG